MNKQLEKDRPIIRAMPWAGAHMSREVLLTREWIVTNGLGGYASGTVSGAVTRRYHGLLIAALPAPLGRVVMWSHVSEFLRFSDDDVVSLGAEERAGGQLDLKSADYLTEFRLEDGLPVWTYHVRAVVVEKRVLLPHLQNTVHVSYQVISKEKTPPRLELRPAFHFRHHEAPVDSDLAAPYKLTAVDGRYEITAARRRLPPLRMQLCGREAAFTIAPAQPLDQPRGLLFHERAVHHEQPLQRDVGHHALLAAAIRIWKIEQRQHRVQLAAADETVHRAPMVLLIPLRGRSTRRQIQIPGNGQQRIA